MYSQRFKMCLERKNNTINTDKTIQTHIMLRIWRLHMIQKKMKEMMINTNSLNP